MLTTTNKNLILFNLKTDADDDILGFTTDWINALAPHFNRVFAITMCAGKIDVAENVQVFSVGKEKGYSEPRRASEFYRILWKILRTQKINDIQLFVKQKKLTEQFYFIGNVGYEKLPEVYAAADVFLLSSHYEGFGRVILEAYMAGVPVVSTACTGPEDIIDSGSTGFLVPPGDCPALTDAVLKLLQDDELREPFGKRGQEKVMKQFSK